MSSIGCTRPRANRWAHRRLTALAAKYLSWFDVTHAASVGRYGAPRRAGIELSKNFARAVPTVFLLSVGSGIAIVPPGRISFAPVFLATCGSGGVFFSTSWIVAVPGSGRFFSPVSRSATTWAKKAAMPQKSFWDHLSTVGWTWHSAHWICTPMKRLPVAPTSFAGDGWLLS